MSLVTSGKLLTHRSDSSLEIIRLVRPQNFPKQLTVLNPCYAHVRFTLELLKQILVLPHFHES